MGTLVSVLGLFLALFLLVYMAYKGHSVIVIAPLIAVVAIVTSSGLDSHIMVNYTEVYMVGFANYVKNYFPLYLLGAVFAKLMEESGNAASIADFVIRKLGAQRAILSVVIACSILTYGGVSLFVVAFVVLPIAITVFQRADVPKRLIPGTLALGSLTFTMTALPGSPQVQNTIPMQYFGTDAFAAPVLGLIASVIMFGCGMLWLNRRAKKAKAAGEGYGGHHDETMEIGGGNVPNIITALVPIFIIIVVNLLCSKLIYPNINSGYLKDFGTVIEKVSGTWSVLAALVVSIIFLIVVNWRKFTDFKGNMKEAANNSLAPLINSCAVVGFGSVIKGLAIFGIVQSFVLGISTNPLVSELLAVNLLCGLTASASGGLGTTLEALAPMYVEMGAKMGIAPAVMHRIASVSSGGLDSLPHNGATVTTLALCKMTHKDSYFDMFMVSVVFPILASVTIVILASLGLRC